MSIPPRLFDPLKVKDKIVLGVEVEHHSEYVRLLWWNDAGDGRRYIVDSHVIPLSNWRDFVETLTRPDVAGF